MVTLAAGVIVSLLGLTLLFGVATGLIGGGPGLALLGFVATLIGLMLGLRAIGSWLQKKPPPGHP